MNPIHPSQETSSSYTKYLTKKTNVQKTYLRDFFLGYKCLKIDRGHKYPAIKLRSVDALLTENDNTKTYYKYGALNLTADPLELCEYIDSQIEHRREELLPIVHAARSIKITGDMLIVTLLDVLEIKEVLLIELAIKVLPEELLDSIKAKRFYKVSMVSLGLYILETMNNGSNLQE